MCWKGGAGLGASRGRRDVKKKDVSPAKELHDHWAAFRQAASRLGVHVIPKTHMVIEAIARIGLGRKVFFQHQTVQNTKRDKHAKLT